MCIGTDIDGMTRFVKYGIYCTASKKQSAIWAISHATDGKEENFKDGSKWITSSEVDFNWDLGRGYKTYKAKKNSTGDWNVEVYPGSTYPIIKSAIFNYYNRAYTLYKDACNFATNYTGGPIVKEDTKTSPNAKYSDNKISVGPYKISKNCEITGVKYYEKIGGKSTEITNADGGMKLCSDINGTKEIDLSKWEGGEFYIVIDTTKVNPSNIEKIEFTYKATTLKGSIYFLVRGSSQKLVSGKMDRSEGSKTTTIEINKTLIPPVEIKLNKKSTLKDDKGQNYDLSGAKFTISYGDGAKNMSLVSGSTSQYYYKWQPTKTNDIDVTIKETTTPSKHQTLSGDIKIKLKLQNGQWVPTIENNPDNFVTITRGTRS